MGAHVNGWLTSTVAYAIAAAVTAMNGFLIAQLLLG
jgi:Mn2+/Fe2+ NRAMP family transporter